MTAGLLVTADGATFRGRAVGAPGVAVGEAVFNTSMTGYQEIITDPSYAGQVVVLTTPHIGNYGVTDLDRQASAPHPTALVVRSLTERPSSWRAAGSLRDYLVAHGLPALADIDTRKLTRHLRTGGAMPVAIGSDVDETELARLAASAPTMDGRDLATAVSTPRRYVVPARREIRARVVAYDFGIKADILSNLAGRGVETVVVPAATPAAAVLAEHPDGVFLSNGPGDPEPLTHQIAGVQALLGRVPVFGVCLGHQILGLALGARTFKLPFGHHGGNHPVRRLADGRVSITAQNHGFAVDLWSLTAGTAPSRRGIPTPDLLPARVDTDYGTVVATHQNLNDGTLEGLECLDLPAFGVQYHPEAAPGPHDAADLFDRFLEKMGAR